MGMSMKFQQVCKTLTDFRERCEALQEQLGYEFVNQDLLLEALTHSSFARDPLPLWHGEQVKYNERLEFLGDAVLGLAVSSYLLLANDSSSEGELSRMRAGIVNSRVLARMATELNIGECLLMSRAEERAGGRAKESLVADALEAIFGAAYLDGGFLAVEVVIQHLLKRFGDGTIPVEEDSKTLLQELTQKLYKATPTYETVLEAGPAHKMMFQVAVNVAGKILGTGEGSTKKQAAQAAARVALQHLRQAQSQMAVRE